MTAATTSFLEHLDRIRDEQNRAAPVFDPDSWPLPFDVGSLDPAVETIPQGEREQIARVFSRGLYYLVSPENSHHPTLSSVAVCGAVNRVFTVGESSQYLVNLAGSICQQQCRNPEGLEVIIPDWIMSWRRFWIVSRFSEKDQRLLPRHPPVSSSSHQRFRRRWLTHLHTLYSTPVNL